METEIMGENFLSEKEEETNKSAGQRKED